jgi:pyruvate kinase
MLSGESATGKYPEEAVAMLAKIAAYTEAHRPRAWINDPRSSPKRPATAAEAITSVVEGALQTVPCVAVFVPTRTGTTARMISGFNPAEWIVALSRDPAVCQELAFSYGVHPVQPKNEPENWRDFARNWLREHELPGAIAMLVAGPSTSNPDANHRLEFLRVGEGRIRPDPSLYLRLNSRTTSRRQSES